MNPEDKNAIRMEAFDRCWASIVLRWIASPEELFHWSARTDFPLTDAAVFEDWHSEAGIAPYALMAGAEMLAYGEIWFDEDDGSAELARLIVSVQRRREGLGRQLVDRLVALAHEAGSAPIRVRVFPANAPALGCYRSAGFSRVPAEQEATLNAGQRFPFHWMVRSPEPSRSPAIPCRGSGKRRSSVDRRACRDDRDVQVDAP